MLWQLLMFARGFVHAQWHQRTLERKSAGSQQGTCPDHWGNRPESERADRAPAILVQGGFGEKKPCWRWSGLQIASGRTLLKRDPPAHLLGQRAWPEPFSPTNGREWGQCPPTRGSALCVNKASLGSYLNIQILSLPNTGCEAFAKSLNPAPHF